VSKYRFSSLLFALFSIMGYLLPRYFESRSCCHERISAILSAIQCYRELQHLNRERKQLTRAMQTTGSLLVSNTFIIIFARLSFRRLAPMGTIAGNTMGIRPNRSLNTNGIRIVIIVSSVCQSNQPNLGRFSRKPQSGPEDPTISF
jgi:hypothetical protein